MPVINAEKETVRGEHEALCVGGVETLDQALSLGR